MLNNILYFVQTVTYMNSMKKMNSNKISNTFLAGQSFKEHHFIIFEDESRSGAASDVPQLIKYQP